MQKSKWHSLSTIEQLANIGAEVGRTISWAKNPAFGNKLEPFRRALEYLDLSITDPKLTPARCRELCRVREVLCDWHFGSRHYHSTDISIETYFSTYAIAVNRQKSTSYQAKTS